MNNVLFENESGFSPIAEITKAAGLKRTIMINYSDSNGVPSVREVEPYELTGNSLFAYCVTKGGIRNFKLDGISSAETTNKTFVPKWEMKI